MATSTKVTVGSSAEEIAAGPGNITIYATGTIVVGGSNLTSSNGFPVSGGVIFPVPLGLALLEKLYALSTTGGNVDIYVLKSSAL